MTTIKWRAFVRSPLDNATNKLLLEILLQQEFWWRPDVDVWVQGIAASLHLDALETG
jgi:hypothetical protein